MKDKSEIKILIVDDVQKNVQVLGTLLKNENYSLVIAQNGKEAIERAVKNKARYYSIRYKYAWNGRYRSLYSTKTKRRNKRSSCNILTAQNTTISKVKGFSM